METNKEKFLAVIKGETISPPPVWFMRQAGRYLPEYRNVRKEAGSFLDLCYDPEKAAEVTVQPIDRFDVSAAILFADILLIPDALGQNVSFVEGEGPVLSPVVTREELAGFEPSKIHETLGPVYETVRRVRARLGDKTALIGFAGAPWTVATYMLNGGSSRDPAALRQHYYNDRAFITDLLAILVETTTDYLVEQIDAGADAVQLFDTWAGGLPEDLTRLFSLEPMAEIAERVRSARPMTPVIMFPKGVGEMLKHYAALDNCAGVGIDFATPWEWARKEISPLATVQGGLDPLLVVKGGEEMEVAAKGLLKMFEGSPYIFNLGHGFVPQTPPENVSRLMEIVREKG